MNTDPTLPHVPVPAAPDVTVDVGTTTADGGAAARTAETLPRVPGYDILGVLGKGGMGIVYKALHQASRRIVALKMILAGGHADAGERERFLTEARAIARLTHAHIVQVHDVGEHDGLPYFSLEFCPGGSLAQHLAGNPIGGREAATLVAHLAGAMQHAHDAGIVHRDLKPANVLLASQASGPRQGAVSSHDEKTSSLLTGAARLESLLEPKITDFGLARQIDSDSGQTQSGAILGTPSYMAPEQARGDSKKVGPAADVYALGAILYEALTGRPPFRTATLMETLHQVLVADPVPPRQLNPACPRDLEIICLKCLAKEPAKRYASAQALADDLHRWLKREPILARPAGLGERLLKWCQRRPTQAVAILVGTLATIAAITGISLALAEAIRQRDRAFGANNDKDIALGLARTARTEAQLKQGLAETSERGQRAMTNNGRYLLAQAAWREQQRGTALERLFQVDAGARGWAWEYLHRQYQGGLMHLLGHASPVVGVGWSPDGERIATGSGDGTVRLWDGQTGTPLGLVPTGNMAVSSLAFAPDGRLAVATLERQVWILDPATGETLLAILLPEIKGRPATAATVVWSPDGARLAVATSERELRLYDSRSGRELLACPDLPQADRPALAWSPDGKRLAYGSGYWELVVYDAATGRRLFIEKQHRNPLRAVAFRPDGRVLATAGQDGRILLWDAATLRFDRVLRELTRYGDDPHATPSALAWLPTGEELAAAWEDGRIEILDPATGSVRRTYTGHDAAVRALAYSPDGRWLLSGGDDRRAVVWSAQEGTPTLALLHRPPTEWITCEPAFTPAGTEATLASREGLDRLSLPTAATLDRLPAFGRDVTALAYSPDGQTLAAGHESGTIDLVALASATVLHRLTGHRSAVRQIVFTAGGYLLSRTESARASRAELIRWDAATGQRIETETASPGQADALPGRLFQSPDGHKLVVQRGRGLEWRDPVTGTAGARLALDGQPLDVAFHPDGETLALVVSGSEEGTGRLLLGPPDRLVAVPAAGGTPLSVTFDPTGATLLWADRGPLVWGLHVTWRLHVFDLATHQERAVIPVDLPRQTPDLLRWRFVQDAGTLVGYAEGSLIVLGGAPAGLALVGVRPQRVALGPNGRLALLASGKQVVLWRPREGTRQELAPLPAEVGVLGVGRAGQLIAARAGAKVHVWDAATGAVRSTHDLPANLRTRHFYALEVDEPAGTLTLYTGGKGLVLDLATGKVLRFERQQPARWSVLVSPEGGWVVRVDGPSLAVVPTAVPPGEQARRRRWLLPAPAWHRELADAAENEGETSAFVAAVHWHAYLAAVPWDFAARIHEAAAWRESGQPEEASRAYLQALLAVPHLPPWPAVPDSLNVNGFILTRQWQKVARAYLLLVRARPDDPGFVRELLAAQLGAGQRAAYRDHRGRLIAALERRPEWLTGSDLIEPCLALPLEVGQAERLVRLAEKRVAARKDADRLLTLAGALLRAGRADDAGRVLAEARAALPPRNKVGAVRLQVLEALRSGQRARLVAVGSAVAGLDRRETWVAFLLLRPLLE